ncbi:MAG TPA: transcription elongation factor GreA [Candidatus Saccharimonadales bacterium]|nr:transcription elongation factor GreA [Candidatus Saccharimonadales bacterium]
MIKKEFHLTPDGVAELKTELEELIAQRGPLAERIKSAREFGDLTENAEYATARSDQERVENRISEIEHILQNVKLITRPRTDNKVQLGSTVKLKGSDSKPKTYKVVGTVEADPSEGKISDESPIGQALLGKQVGEQVEIKTPIENLSYKVVEIS